MRSTFVRPTPSAAAAASSSAAAIAEPCRTFFFFIVLSFRGLEAMYCPGGIGVAAADRDPRVGAAAPPQQEHPEVTLSARPDPPYAQRLGQFGAPDRLGERFPARRH